MYHNCEYHNCGDFGQNRKLRKYHNYGDFAGKIQICETFSKKLIYFWQRTKLVLRLKNFEVTSRVRVKGFYIDWNILTGVGIRTLDNSDSRARLGQNGLGSAFGRTNPQKSSGQARTIGQIRTTRPLFGHSARFGHSDSSDNSDKAEPSFPTMILTRFNQS